MAKDRPDLIGRRELLALGLAAGSIAAAEAAAPHDGLLGAPTESIKGSLPWQDGMTDAPPAPEGGTFLSAAELAFVTAAADRIVPADPTGPSASEAGVPTFIDRQLAGGYGRGDHLFMGGPWPKGAPTQGYQSRFAPALFYRTAIADIEAHVGSIYSGKAFKDLAPDQQDALLKQCEDGKVQLRRVEAKAFFTMFLQNVMEGYFSDPIYGGNRDMAAWKMIGFPGAHYDYSEWVTRYNQKVPIAPVGLSGRPGWDQA
ncbi:MAG TPA: gluconate 2-dehydrogenase subunit 3 family protein [Allosphingosinicella sp.]|nr:gluconate 2-dehydrogenase subunit 3 family protein [Allosphingosinicella sp.]